MFKCQAARLAQKGFTLIELAIVIVILGILAATAVPKFMNVQSSAIGANKNASNMSVQSAFAIATAYYEGYPTLTSLNNAIQGGTHGILAGNEGIYVTIKSNDYKALTYQNADCITPTSGPGNTVKCVWELGAS